MHTSRYTLTELAALSHEARPAGALPAQVVAVRPVLTAAHFSTAGAVEPGRAAWKGGGSHIRDEPLISSLHCGWLIGSVTQDRQIKPNPFPACEADLAWRV